MTLGFTILIITISYIQSYTSAEDQQNLNLYRDFIRPHICWRGCESTNLGMQTLGQFCLTSTFQVPVKVPACVSWAFIATSFTEVRRIYRYIYIYMYIFIHVICNISSRSRSHPFDAHGVPLFVLLGMLGAIILSTTCARRAATKPWPKRIGGGIQKNWTGCLHQ